MTKKICVLGSSYIGAVYSAYRDRQPAGEAYEIDFYGHSNGGFPNVEVIGGHFRNVRFRSSAQSVDVRNYDALVIYADLPSPHDIAKLTAGCGLAGCSRQVTEAVVSDVIKARTAFRLFETLRDLTGKPVFLVSANVVLISKAKMTDARYAYNVGMIENTLGEGVYIPFPREIFDEAYLPIDEFYKGSIALTGDRPEGGKAGHDNHHMNESGGALVLAGILARLDTVFGEPEREAA
jgi:hypothetical protein